ncbi:MAG: hypothetical protein HY074_07880 [Deltaproteobacteria bacterium]|nr:hypothetical protein [Deltaproteobacteria bacterium]
MPSTKCDERRRVNDKPLYQITDYLKVRRAMDDLSAREKRIIELRFFHRNTIDDIAVRFRMTWDEADEFIDLALGHLRMLCREEPTVVPYLQFDQAA